MADKSIYIDGIGYRNPIADADQIIWYFEQRVKTHSSKYYTKYWLSLYTAYADILLKNQAYELYGYLIKKTTSAQQERKKALAQRTKVEAKQELAQWIEYMGDQKIKQHLISLIRNN